MILTLPFGAQQTTLPGVPEPAGPAHPDFALCAGWPEAGWRGVAHWHLDEIASAVSADQLWLGSEQPVLHPEPRPAVQLPLLPDLPLWEAPEAPVRAKPRRRARRKPVEILSPGQMSLF